MSRLERYAIEHPGGLWALTVAIALTIGAGAALLHRAGHERGELAKLRAEAARFSHEIQARTLNGQAMGGLALLGRIDTGAREEALGQRAANSDETLRSLRIVAQPSAAEGAFIIRRDGVIGSSWGSGASLTGADARSQPYFQVTQRGEQNVYAAVGAASGKRTIYLAAPLHAGQGTATPAVGAVVIRASTTLLDHALREMADRALLLTPQGVVFASSESAWYGRLAGPASPDRMQAIRASRQFGALFEDDQGLTLPFALGEDIVRIDGRRHVLASAPLAWNDPGGDWTLVLLRDLPRHVPLARSAGVGFAATALALFIGFVLIRLLHGRQRASESRRQLEDYARSESRSAELKAGLARVALDMQQSPTMEDVTQVFLRQCHAAFQMLQGVVYLAVENPGEDAALRLAGSYACTDAPPDTLAAGEGLLGQGWLDRQERWLTGAALADRRIRSGLGDCAPAAMLLSPVLLNDQCLGIVELAFLRAPDASARAALGEWIDLLAMNLQMQARTRSTHAKLHESLEHDRARGTQMLFQQALVDTIPYPVFYKGPDSRFLGFNRAYEAAFNIRRQDMIGKRVLDLEYLPEADRLAYQAEDEAVIASTGSIQHRMRIPYADGVTRDTLYFVSGFRLPDGSPGGLVGTFIDLSTIGQPADTAQESGT